MSRHAGRISIFPFPAAASPAWMPCRDMVLALQRRLAGCAAHLHHAARPHDAARLEPPRRPAPVASRRVWDTPRG
eukprot:349686-Chlamydomonas_euryale.AAC.16